MAAIIVTPPPLSTDLIDTRAVRFRQSSTLPGQMEIVPGSLTASAPWLIWFNSNFVTAGAASDVIVLEALDEGVGVEAATALRDAQAALYLEALNTSPAVTDTSQSDIVQATQPASPDSTSAISGLLSTIYSLPTQPDLTTMLQNMQTALALACCGDRRNQGVMSGLHADRSTIPAGGLNLSRVYFETDRNALYTSINNVWTYMAGIMVAAAASRPVDLATSDMYFFFLASDTLTFSYWDGAAWNTVTSGSAQTTGTWTAAITFGGGNTGITYSSTQTMNYVKTGSTVTTTVDLTLSSKGSSTGVAEITGLPFNPSAAEITLGCWQYGTNLSGLTSTPVCLPFVGGSKITLSHFGSTGSTQLTDTNFTNTSRIILSVTYQA